MAIRILSSLLIVLALLVAPVAMGAGWSPAAAAPLIAETGHVEGHCGGAAPAGERKAPIHLGCAGSCAAMPSVEPRMDDLVILPPRPPLRAMSTPLSGVAPEHETPPPRTVRPKRT